MLILKIKQAEKALAGGRLDEAFDLLQETGVREHCRGQALADRLSGSLLQRAQDHLDQGHLPQALTDCNRAARICGQSPEVTSLRQAICQCIDQRMNDGQEKQEQLARIQKQLDLGRLSIGEDLLQDLDNDRQAGRLGQEVRMQRLEIDHVRQELEQALAADNLDQALTVLTRDWDAIVAANGRCEPLIQDIKMRALEQLRLDFNAGHVRRAQAGIIRLQPVTQSGDPIDDFALAVAFCVDAARALETGQVSQAVQLLQKAKTLLPDVTWLGQALKQAQDAAAQIDAVHTGPLGLLDRNITTSPEPMAQPMKPQSEPPRPQAKPYVTDPAPAETSAYLLQVNGIGSYLIYTQSQLSVGPISSSARPDLGILADPSLPAVTLLREEDDYFLRSNRPVKVDQATVKRCLLADGQRICLSDRCRIKFNRPNAASTTATLSFTGGRLPRNDIRYAILMDDCLLIGPSTNHHIRIPELQAPITLIQRQGRLYCQSNQSVRVAGQPHPAGSPLPLKQTLTLGEVSLVLTPAD